jgi:hypothetical protein
VLSMDEDMRYVTLTRSLVVQLDPRCDDTYLRENYVPHGTTKKIVKVLML